MIFYISANPHIFLLPPVECLGGERMRIFFKHNARLLLAAAAVLFFCGALSRLFAADAAIQTGSWGLSFQQEGRAPVGNASQSALRNYDAVYVGNSADKVIYLTFDAGYENGCTGQILDVLKQHNVKACFFVVGTFLAQNPDLVRRMTEEGHTIGNHTWHHYNMSKIADKETFSQELSSVEDKYREITGKEMSKYYRPPQGVYSEENLKMAKALGYRTVFWSLAYVDWYQDDQPTAEEAFGKLLPRIHPGAIVLLHSTSATNAAILDELLTKWEDMGYRFGTLDELYKN
jgi:peptidoglycan-N-acetylmuramic acid deacetylase